MSFRVCTVCNVSKSINLFHKKKGGKLDRRADCSTCVAAYQKERRSGPKRQLILEKKRQYHKVHPEVKYRNHLKSKYKITIEEYKLMLIQQNYSCAVCGSKTPANNQHKNLYVDHNHITNKVRGLLCNPCNTTIGASKENLDRLVNCIAYLNKFNK